MIEQFKNRFSLRHWVQLSVAVDCIKMLDYLLPKFLAHTAQDNIPSANASILSQIKRSLVCLAVIFSLLSTVTVSAQPIALDLLNGKKEISFPFELRQGLIMVEMLMDNALPVNFIFDTGAENTVLFHKEYADLLGYEYDTKVRVMGSDFDGLLYAMVVRGSNLSIGNKIEVLRDILVLDKDIYLFREKLGFNVDGVLGGSFFKGMILKIDYKKNRITVKSPNDFIKPNKYSTHKITVKENKPYLETDVCISDDRINKSVLLIDTGAALPILLHSNTDEMLVMPEFVLSGSIGYGLGGVLNGFTGRIKSFQIQKYRFDEVLTSFQNIDTSGVKMDKKFVRNGIIGNGILSRFHVIINYLDEELYLKPMKRYNKKFEFDKSGLTIFAFGPKLKSFIIKQVLLDSPAAEAGLKEGDIIKKIQWRRNTFWSLEGINKLLRKKEGKKIKLIIDRNGEMIKVKFRLRNLLKAKPTSHNTEKK